MGALTPAFLAAAVAVGVPIFIHLFQRQDTRRLAFPALRYLERTERERAREIRLRQLLLLLARVTVLLLVVGAGARLFTRGRGTAHPPTAAVLVVDNSMSSGVVVGERRTLDRLKALALETLDQAGEDDLFWVLRAGEPWLPALPGDATQARTAVEAIEPSDAAGDLADALSRAEGLLATADRANKEIHLLTDLQATAFAGVQGSDAVGVPVVVPAFFEPPPANVGIISVLVGGGLPPLLGQRTEASVAALGDAPDTSRLPLRIVIDDRVRAAATVSPGSATSLALPPAGAGWVRGFADLDPDALRADDRRYFAFRSRPASRVGIAGAPGLFVEQAVGVLEEAGRATAAAVARAELLVSAEGEGLDALGSEGAALVLPPADGARLPALNRRLAEAGIPWRYGPHTGSGEVELTGRLLPEPLEGARARGWYALEPVGEPSAASSVLVSAGSASWAVQGEDARGRRFLLVASPLDESSTTLPVSTGMLRFLDWAASEWAGRGGSLQGFVAGEHLPAPRGASHVRLPSGEVREVDGTRTVRATGEAGFYTFLEGDAQHSVAAVNAPAEESALARLTPAEVARRLGPSAVVVEREDAWSRSVYRARQGPELWRPLLLLALLLLLAEALLGASGRADRRSARAQPGGPSVDAAA